MSVSMWMPVVAAVVVGMADIAAASCKTVTTFNTGMTPTVENYRTRRGLIDNALAAESADVLCLQEVWYEDDMRHLIEDLKSIYPNHYSGIHTEVNKLENDEWSWYARSACDLGEIWSLVYRVLPCAYRESCVSVFFESSEAGLDCLAEKCRDVLQHEDIDANCVSCLVLSSDSVSDVFDRCYKLRGSDLRLNPSGLMVFSKTKLPEPPKTFYKTYFEGQDQTLHRGYIQTEVAGVGTVVCTHLTSVFEHYYEYDLPYGSYAAQSMEEVRRIHARLGNSDHLLVGDFNTGIEVRNSDPEKNLTAEGPKSHALLTSYGYDTDKYLSDDGRCTYCNSNKIVEGYNNAIDDVLVMGDHFTSVTKKRVLDQNNPPLSDHYGVRARVCKN